MTSYAPTKESILGLVEQTDTCWLWTGYIENTGYGRFYAQREGHVVPLAAHRLAYELFVGPIPAGLQIDHLCRVRDCVNPAHLEPVTKAENQRRGLAGELTTHCPKGHPYDATNTLFVKGRNARQCRECHRQFERARRARRLQERTAALQLTCRYCSSTFGVTAMAVPSAARYCSDECRRLRAQAKNRASWLARRELVNASRRVHR